MVSVDRMVSLSLSHCVSFFVSTVEFMWLKFRVRRESFKENHISEMVFSKQKDTWMRIKCVKFMQEISQWNEITVILWARSYHGHLTVWNHLLQFNSINIHIYKLEMGTSINIHMYNCIYGKQAWLNRDGCRRERSNDTNTPSFCMPCIIFACDI